MPDCYLIINIINPSPLYRSVSDVQIHLGKSGQYSKFKLKSVVKSAGKHGLASGDKLKCCGACASHRAAEETSREKPVQSEL